MIERAYAKINLSLEVLNTDERNYHLVNTIMVPINIYDEIELEKNDEIIIVNDDINDNIMYKAAVLFFNSFNIKGGVRIKYKKNIPLAAGLAGGSSDAAAVLRGLRRLYKPDIADSELEYICSFLGSDVAFFIKTRLAKCTHYGEVINPIDIKLPKMKVLLIKPNFGLSTKLVYQNYQYEKCDRSIYEENIYKALINNDSKLLDEYIFNDLNKTSLLLSSDLRYLYTILSKYDKIHISGSGPTMFILNPSEENIERIREEIKEDTYVKVCSFLV